MKKLGAWVKIVLALLFFVGGLGNIGKNTGAAIFGIVLGVAFAAWLIIGLKKASKRRTYNEPAAQPPVKPAQTSPTEEKPVAQEKAVDIVIPDRIGSAFRKYYYSDIAFNPFPTAEQLALEMQQTNDWSLEAVKSGGGISLNYHGRPLGVLDNADKAKMVSDWIERGDPFLVFLSHYGEKNTVGIAFYLDEQSRLRYRESTVSKLTRYAGEDAQFSLSLMSDGEPLDFDEEDDGVVAISDIGYLPKSVAARYNQEGAAGVFIDHIDYDDEKDKYIPYVKIYW